MLVIKLTVVKSSLCSSNSFCEMDKPRRQKTTVLLAPLLVHEPNSELWNTSLSPTNLRLDKQKKLASCVIMLSRHKQGAG